MLIKLLVLVFILGKSSQYDYTATIKKVVCQFNKDYFVNGSCTSTPVKRYVTKVNVKADLIKEMTDVQLRVSVFYKYTVYQPFVIDYTIDYCEFRKNNAYNKMMDIFIQYVSRFSNNTHECPFTPPEQFNLKDAVIETDLFPKFLPTGEYRMDSEYKSSKNVTYALLETFIETRSRSLVDLKMG